MGWVGGWVGVMWGRTFWNRSMPSGRRHASWLSSPPTNVIPRSTQYLYTRLHPSETAKTITVFDVKGVGLGDLVGDAFHFLKRSAHLIAGGFVHPKPSGRRHAFKRGQRYFGPVSEHLLCPTQ